MKKLRKQLNFYAREGEIKFVFYTNKLIIFSFTRAKKKVIQRLMMPITDNFQGIPSIKQRSRFITMYIL